MASWWLLKATFINRQGEPLARTMTLPFTFLPRPWEVGVITGTLAAALDHEEQGYTQTLGIRAL